MALARSDPADERQNLFWEAPRIHGELKLGFSVAQSSVAK
jgi:hypothetical protein